jgi:enoyl-CoA hydratase/carnithine racemase
MAYDNYNCLKIRVDNGVAFVTIDNPPINIFNMQLIIEMNMVGLELEADDDVRVVVLQSANPDFFIAHADVEMILTIPEEVPPKAEALGPFHEMVDRFRTMPKATIAKIEGMCRGGGSELVLSCDMRFAALGKAILGQPEASVGIIPGGGGTQRLPRLMGRSRALEVMLGCEDFPADLAERYGYINRAFPPEELTPFVESLAYRIASCPAEAIGFVKASVAGAEPPVEQGLIDEAHYFNQAAATPEARRRMSLFLEMGGQTAEAELSGMQAFSDKLKESE